MRITWSGGSVESERDPGREPGNEVIAPDPRRGLGNEEVGRITVEPEDRLAFRVGVNILTLVLVGLAVYLVWRRYFAGA